MTHQEMTDQEMIAKIISMRNANAVTDGTRIGMSTGQFVDLLLTCAVIVGRKDFIFSFEGSEDVLWDSISGDVDIFAEKLFETWAREDYLPSRRV